MWEPLASDRDRSRGESARERVVAPSPVPAVPPAAWGDHREYVVGARPQNSEGAPARKRVEDNQPHSSPVPAVSPRAAQYDILLFAARLADTY